MSAEVFDDRRCILGEGPLWHPGRAQLFWFDITGQKLLSRDGSGPLEWEFDAPVSAAGWIDADHLLIASDSALWRFDLTDGSRTRLCPLEDQNPATRSNDGRADPWGGFWISTMGRRAETGAGAIYRYHRGALRRLFGDITIPNAICFAPDRSCAYFTDTAEAKVMRVPLDPAGWPSAVPHVLTDLSAEALNPDGAVVDSTGNLWIAQWGAGRIAIYGDDGAYQSALPVPALHATCPAFGGPGFETVYVTSATQGLPRDVATEHGPHGQTFALAGVAKGVPEPQVIL